MNEKQRGSKGSETVHSAVGIAQEHADAAVDLAAFSPRQGTFDMAFAWDSPTRMAWDDMLETFTMDPFS